MKRRISLLLAVIVIFTLVLPIQAFAETMDQSLENAIKIAKTKFEIPDNYRFESNISTDGAKKIFYLNWNSKDTIDGSSISVTVNEDGVILSYYTYSSSDYTQTKKLPALSRQEAAKKAEEYIKSIDADLLAQIKLQDANQNYSLDSSYYFNYYRVVNGLPFYNNSVYVTISRQTGKLQNFSRNWTFGLTFPTPKSITLDAAKQAYKDNMGLKLIYKYSYDYSKNVLRLFPAYVPVYENGSYVLDAVTGERAHIGYYYGIMYDQAMGGASASAKTMNSSVTEVILDPDEQKAVSDAAKLKTLEEVEAIAKAAGFTGITNEYKLDNYSLYANWPLREEYTWSLNYSKTDADKQVVSNIYVGVNANTGVIQNYYSYSSSQQGTKAVYTQKDAKAAADKLLAAYYADFVKQVKYDELYTEEMVANYGTTEPTSFSLRYIRLVNGIEFPDNSINIEYNAITGEISNLNMAWFNTTFPALNNTITLDAAYEKLFENVGLNLEYRLKTQSFSRYGTITETPEVMLAYALDTTKPHIISAVTGNLLDYNGDVYKEAVLVSYTDIAGSYAENQITVLAENGISLEGTEFKPATVILQKDFLLLLSKTLNYYGIAITDKSSQEEIDNLYSYLIREGIVKEGEKAPNVTVTREEAVKYIIRAMKFDKVADLKDLYKASTFADRGQITEGLEAYISIAAGLKIINGYNGSFNPKGGLTRAAAAVMIYNYLQAS